MINANDGKEDRNNQSLYKALLSLENGTTDQEFIKSLFINLSPYDRTDSSWQNKMRQRKPVIVEKKKSVKQNRIDQLKIELDKLKREKKLLDNEIKSTKLYKIVGMRVKHSVLGNGVITQRNDNDIHVDFKGDVRKMTLPGDFYKGYLISEHKDFIKNLKTRMDLEKRVQDYKNRYSRVKAELKELNANF